MRLIFAGKSFSKADILFIMRGTNSESEGVDMEEMLIFWTENPVRVLAAAVVLLLLLQLAALHKIGRVERAGRSRERALEEKLEKLAAEQESFKKNFAEGEKNFSRGENGGKSGADGVSSDNAEMPEQLLDAVLTEVFS